MTYTAPQYPAQATAAPVLVQQQPAAPVFAPQASASPAVRLTLETVEGCMALQRMGEVFARSTIVPKAYQGNVSNCIIAIDIASRMELSPLMVFQNLNVIQGKPSWSSSFIIAAFNRYASDFGPMGFEFFGQEGTMERGCRAYAIAKATGEKVYGPVVTRQMAMKEGWQGKWTNMPELMLRYRAAAFFVRTTCPEILFGLYTEEEQEDIVAGNARIQQPAAPTVQQPSAQPQPADSTAKKMVEAFKPMGVTPDMLANLLGHDVHSLSQEELQQLRMIFLRIKGNPAAAADIFPELAARQEEPAEEAAPAPAKKTRKKAAKAAPAQEEETPAERPVKRNPPVVVPTREEVEAQQAAAAQEQAAPEPQPEQEAAQPAEPDDGMTMRELQTQFYAACQDFGVAADKALNCYWLRYNDCTQEQAMRHMVKNLSLLASIAEEVNEDPGKFEDF